MRLAVFDTNVIVSAAINRDGAPAKLVMDWVLEGLVQVVACPEVVAEYWDVVNRKKFSRYEFPPESLEFLIDHSLKLPDPKPWPHLLPDREDGLFLAFAHEAGAWLVTGNLKHYPASGRGGVRVLSPAEYLSQLNARG